MSRYLIAFYFHAESGEDTARRRFNALLDEEHALGFRKARGRSLYQIICDENDNWVALVLWTGAFWHLGARDNWVGWDAMTRSERLQLFVHQARFLGLQNARDSVWNSALLAAAVRDLTEQCEEVFDYRPLPAETFTDPETHEGTCYKAADWEPAGLSSGEGSITPINFRKAHDPGPQSTREVVRSGVAERAASRSGGLCRCALCVESAATVFAL